MINEKRLLNIFLQLASINSPSKKERALADYLIKHLQGLGLIVREDQAGKKIGGNCGNLYCNLASTNPVLTPIAFCAHLDTVKETTDSTIRIEDGWIRTDGSTILGADDKAGIAIMLELVHQIFEQKLQHGGIELIFTVAEETGLEGAKNFNMETLNAKLGFVLDSGDQVGTYVVQAPTEYEITIAVHGKPAHAGVEPEKGVNAIYIAAQALAELPMGRIDENTTFNIGKIAGGEMTNIVPDYVQLEGELRSLQEKKAEILVESYQNIFTSKISSLGGNAKFKAQKAYFGFDLSNNYDLEKLLTLASKKIGINAHAVSRGGASDANIFNQKNLVTTNLGLGMQEEHTNNEKIQIQDLVKSARLIYAIVEALSNLS